MKPTPGLHVMVRGRPYLLLYALAGTFCWRVQPLFVEAPETVIVIGAHETLTLLHSKAA